MDYSPPAQSLNLAAVFSGAVQAKGDVLVPVDDHVPADGHGHQVVGNVVAEVGNGQDGQGIAPQLPFPDDVPQVIPDKPQVLPLDHPVIAVLAVIGQRTDDQAADFVKDLVPAQGG